MVTRGQGAPGCSGDLEGSALTLASFLLQQYSLRPQESHEPKGKTPALQLLL